MESTEKSWEKAAREKLLVAFSAFLSSTLNSKSRRKMCSLDEKLIFPRS
jgi:hypothetical protein